jgi:dTDP-4-dehydrorhamnose 3,5-epimerase
MSMLIKELRIPGCYELQPPVHRDARGVFVKTFHEEDFMAKGLCTDFKEDFYTVSHQRVLRGLHVQVPPREHVKIVHCIAGSVLDVVLDLRIGSPRYGEFELLELSSDKRNFLYIAQGIAHGFYVTSPTAILLYKVSSMHSPDHDTGILWNSAGIPWPDIDPILSERDSRLVPLREFKSPFSYRE